MRADSPVQCIADVHAVLGEGPVWVARESALYWLDIKGRKIFRIDEAGALQSWDTPMRVGSLAPRASGGFIAGTDQGFAHIDPEAGEFEVLHHPEAHLPENRFNDGKVDRHGRFWAGTMDDTEQHVRGTLYRLHLESAGVAVDGEYKVTNGPAFSPSGDIMYHNDSALQVTYAFDLDADGELSSKRTFLQFDEGDGYPDGMTVDAEGCLWIAFWDGWCLRRFSPDGELVSKLDMPVARPTSCAFGGPDLDKLFISSASIGLDEQALIMQPNAGGLFMVVPGVKGTPQVPFAG
jgi:sugar lactone lactonase YvrE